MHRLKNAPVIMVIRRTFSYGKVFIFPILCRHYNYCGKTAKKKKKNRQSTNLIWQREVYENRVPDCCFYTTRLTAACIASAR